MSSIEQEAEHYNNNDMEIRRAVSWSRLAAPHIRRFLYKDSNRDEYLSLIMKNRINGKGLTLACGDMKAEARYFKRLNIYDVDAYDVSEKSLKRAGEYCDKLGLNVNIQVADVNDIKLEKNKYDLVVLCHAYHHLDNIGYIGEQIANSLKDNGVFLLLDYIGPRYIQFTNQQILYGNEVLKKIPKKLRYDRKGDLITTIRPPLRWGLSVHEAIQSPRIMPTIENYFKCIKGMLYGGIMHPVFERIASNFNLDNEEHERLIKEIWQIEFELIQGCEVEPNFCELILVKKDSEYFKDYPNKRFKYKKLEDDARYENMIQVASNEIWRLRKIIKGLREAIEKRESRIDKLLKIIR